MANPSTYTTASKPIRNKSDVDPPPGRVPLHDPAETESSRKLLLQFISEAQTKYKALPSKTFLIGFSQGAIMAFSIALHFPEVIAGIAALSGRILPKHAAYSADLKSLEGFPVLLSHGTQDEVLTVDYARSARAILERLPVSLSYHEYPMGHVLTDMNFIDVKEWLSSRLQNMPSLERTNGLQTFPK